MRIIIGITGGTGCGKTTVLQLLQEEGFHVIDCDAVYHELLRQDKEMLLAIDAAFPGSFENGHLDRKRLGQAVFSNEAALDKLNHTVWPFVCRAVQARLDTAAPENCAIDAIGLFESGLDRLCTHTIAVTAPTQARIRRLMARDDISEAYAALRVGAQKSNEEFAALCTLVLDNSYETSAEFRQYAQHALKETIL
ncbi:MAG: dephospho-CoA kinase [Oscillospiraceae bacterium]|nr:dephospho-CoA kinase [Oscillospiraceae bacterium]